MTDTYHFVGRAMGTLACRIRRARPWASLFPVAIGPCG
jgi:hypothetical protein